MSASYSLPIFHGIVQNKMSVHRYIVRQYSDIAEVHVHTRLCFALYIGV